MKNGSSFLVFAAIGLFLGFMYFIGDVFFHGQGYVDALYGFFCFFIGFNLLGLFGGWRTKDEKEEDEERFG